MSQQEDRLYGSLFQKELICNYYMVKIIINYTTPHEASNIWMDDTAAMIKQKLLSYVGVSVEEMYLFLYVTTKINPVDVYKTLSMNGRVAVKVKSLKRYLENIVDLEITDEFEGMTDKNTVPFSLLEDIFNDEEYTVAIPFGINFGIDKTSMNSDMISFGYMPIQTDTRKTSNISLGTYTSTSNSEETLLSKVPITGRLRRIYAITASTAMSAYKHSSMDEFLKIYFPKLVSKIPEGVNDYQREIERIRPDLFSKSKQLLKENAKYYTNLDYWNNTLTENYEEPAVEGITGATVTYMSLLPNTPVSSLPLEFIFKSINSTPVNPFIRYIISQRREQLIRLYSPKETADGKKIPAMSRSDVNRVIMKSKKAPGLGLLFIPKIKNISNLYVFLELKENSQIVLRIETKETTPIPFEQFKKIATSTIEYFVKRVNEIIKQTSIQLTSLKDVLLETQITNIDWTAAFPLKTPRDIFSTTKARLGLPVFIQEDVMRKEQGRSEKDATKKPKLKNEMDFIYTRISNFSVDMPYEVQTHIHMNYSVDNHMLYVEMSNIPSIQYVDVSSQYMSSFVSLLYHNSINADYKDVALTSYAYKKQAGEEEIEAEIIKDLLEKEHIGDEDDIAEEVNDMDRLLMERMLDVIPDSPNEDEIEETELEDIEDLDIESDEEEEEEEEEEKKPSKSLFEKLVPPKSVPPKIDSPKSVEKEEEEEEEELEDLEDLDDDF